MTTSVTLGTRRRPFARAAIFIATLQMSAGAFAAEELEEVVVTAQKRQESLMDVPISISVLQADDLLGSTLSSTTDLASRIPGLEATPSTHGGSNSNFYIRGVGQVDFISTVEPGVGVYLDGVYIARSVGSTLDLLDIERVEVLRGPQGTVFGKNTIGGAVNVVTRRPDLHETSGIAQLRMGERDRMNASFSANVPMIDDRLAASVSFSSKNQDGYGISLYDDRRRSDEKRIAGRASLLWKASDAVDVLLSADVTRAREASRHSVALAVDPNTFVTADQNAFAVANGIIPYDERYVVGDDPFVNQAGFDPGNTVDIWGTQATVTWNINPDLQLRSITAYRDLRVRTGLDFDASPSAIADQDVADDQHQLSQELLLSGTSFDKKLDWVAGAFYMREKGLNDILLRLSFEENPVGLDTDTSNAYTNKTWALFSQGTYHLTDRMHFTAGVRYNHDKKEDGIRNFATKFGVDLVPFTTLDDSWNSTTWRLGLQYDLTDSFISYVSAGSGFKSGGFNGRAFSLGEFASFAPEKVRTYELGLKGDLLDRHLRVTAAGYYSDYTDIQTTVNIADPVTGQPLNVVENAAAAEIYGIELDASAILGEHWRLDLGATSMHAKYTELREGSSLTRDDDLPQTPKWTFLAGLEGSYPVGSAAKVTMRADYVYKDDFFHNSQNSIYNHEDAYGLLNLRLSYGAADDRWNIAAYALNVTDKEYMLFREDLLAFMAVTAIPAPPREIGAEFTYRW